MGLFRYIHVLVHTYSTPLVYANDTKRSIPKVFAQPHTEALHVIRTEVIPVIASIRGQVAHSLVDNLVLLAASLSKRTRIPSTRCRANSMKSSAQAPGSAGRERSGGQRTYAL